MATEAAGQGDVLCERYRLGALIGAGGMATIFEAQDMFLNQRVAIKILKPPSANGNANTGRKIIEDLRNEARASIRLAHPNIVRAYNYERDRDRELLVTELVDGEDLKRFRRRYPHETLSVERVIDIGVQACAGLEHARTQGIHHLDIKPANLLLTRDGVLKICDFGLSALSMSAPFEERMYVGTPQYMSPEMIRERRADHRSDLYALAGTLFDLATGEPPFGMVVSVCFRAHLDTPVPRPANLPPALVDVLQRALAKDPADRFQTAAEMGAALEACRTTERRASRPSAETRVEQLTYEVGSASWSDDTLPRLDSRRTLITVFGEAPCESIEAPLAELRAAYPTSMIVGCSGPALVAGARVEPGTLAVTIIEFEGVELRSGTREPPRLCLAFASGPDEATFDPPPGIAVGGVAGTGEWVVSDGLVRARGVAQVVLSSARFVVAHHHAEVADRPGQPSLSVETATDVATHVAGGFPMDSGTVAFGFGSVAKTRPDEETESLRRSLPIGTTLAGLAGASPIVRDRDGRVRVLANGLALWLLGERAETSALWRSTSTPEPMSFAGDAAFVPAEAAPVRDARREDPERAEIAKKPPWVAAAIVVALIAAFATGYALLAPAKRAGANVVDEAAPSGAAEPPPKWTEPSFVVTEEAIGLVGRGAGRTVAEATESARVEAWALLAAELANTTKPRIRGVVLAQPKLHARAEIARRLERALGSSTAITRTDTWRRDRDGGHEVFARYRIEHAAYEAAQERLDEIGEGGGLTVAHVAPIVDGPETGLLVVAVDAGSPTNAAGIRVGDVVRTVAGQPVESPEAFAREWKRAWSRAAKGARIPVDLESPAGPKQVDVVR